MRMLLLATVFSALVGCVHDHGPRPVYYQCFESAAVAAAFPDFVQATVAARPLDYEALANITSLEIIHRRVRECHSPQVTVFLNDPAEGDNYKLRSAVQRELSTLANEFSTLAAVGS